MIKKTPIIIDTDPGIDDAAALGIALYREELDVKLITTVHGNVDVDKTTMNALKLLTFFDKDIPVARGMDRPLIVPRVGSKVHGESGMDGYEFPNTTKSVMKEHAVEAMYQVLSAANEEITLVPIGSLTNIAVLLRMYPQMRSKINRIVMMGGSLCGGNVTSAAEFNIWADPHAAQIVFESGIEIVMIGLDVTLQALIGEKQLCSFIGKSKSAEMFHAIFQHYCDGDIHQGVAMHDACAIAYVTSPEIFNIEPRCVTIITEGVAKGMTMEVSGKPNAKVAIGIDAEAFQQWFMKTLDVMI